MKLRKILAVALIVSFAFPLAVQAQSPWGTAAFQSWKQGVTAAGQMGVPRFATAALPTCDANNLSALAWDTTTSAFKVCNGSAFAAVGGGGASPISFNDDVALTFGTGNDSNVEYDTAQTPDATVFRLGTDSRVLWIAETGDTADYGLAQQTNPTLAVHSALDTAAQYISLSHNQTNGVIDVGTGLVSIPDGISVAGISASGTVVFTTGINVNNDQTMGLGTSGGTSGLEFDTANTPDTILFKVGSASNAVLIEEIADAGTDFAHAQQTHPTVFVHSANTSPTTQYLGISAHGTQTELFKALTAAAATSIVQIPVAAGTGTGGVVHYTVYATDGTDMQTRTGFVRFTAVNKAGTETCGMSNDAGAADASITETEDGNAVALSAGTLTYAITCSTASANAVEFQINAASSLTETVLRAYYTVTITGPGSPLLQ